MENEVKAESNGIGGVTGAVIIIILLIIGGWYFIGNRLEKIEQQKANMEVGDVVTGDSTEVEDIQTDLNNLDLKVLD